MTHTVQTFAKINTSLKVFGPNPQGYHPICSIFQSISLYDELIISPNTQNKFILTCSNPDIPVNEHNILLKICHKLANKIPSGLTIHLVKNIPHGGGLGGGSANAAGLILYLNKVLNWDYSNLKLIKLGLQFGADVPFCLVGGTACVRGIGEKITPVKFESSYTYLLIFPKISVSTQTIFKAFDRSLTSIKKPTKTPKSFLSSKLGINELKPITFDLYPELQNVEKIILQHNQQLYMSGSGSTCFVPFKNYTDAEQFYNQVKSYFTSDQLLIVQEMQDGCKFNV